MFGLDRETPITARTYDQLCLDMAIVRECIERICSAPPDQTPTVLYAQGRIL